MKNIMKQKIRSETGLRIWKMVMLLMLVMATAIGMTTRTEAANTKYVQVYTEPSSNSWETNTSTYKNIQLEEGVNILSQLPATLSYSSESHDYIFTGYAIYDRNVKGYVRITNNMTYSINGYYNIKSLWKLKRWDEYDGNTYSHTNGKYHILTGSLDAGGGRYTSYGSLYTDALGTASYYYPWENTVDSIIIGENVSIDHYAALSVSGVKVGSSSTYPDITINTIKINPGVSSNGLKNYLSGSSTIYAHPTHWETIKEYFYEDKIIKISSDEYKFGSINWSYNSDNKILKISGTGDMPNGNYPWAILLQNYGLTTQYVKTIIIDNGITSIGTGAFNNTGYTKLYIGKNVKTIGANAFNCTDVKVIYNGYTANQNIGSNAFANLQITDEEKNSIIYVPANINFANLINGKATNYIPTNAKGNIEIRNGKDWYNYIMMLDGLGNYEIMNDFSFQTRVDISYYKIIYWEETNKSDRPYKPIYQNTTETKDNYALSPVRISYEDVPKSYKEGTEEKTIIQQKIDLYGNLYGNGHTITQVNHGLFNNNYGTITDLNISCVENSAAIDTVRQTAENSNSSWTSYRTVFCDYVAPVASINYGTVDKVEVQGRFAGSRIDYDSWKDKDDSSYNYYQTDSSKDHPAGGVVGLNEGLINKSGFVGWIRGVNVGGICYENKGTIYGCYNEGSMYGEAYAHERGKSRWSLSQNSELGGICVINNDTVEQSYGAAQISAHSYVYIPCSDSADYGNPPNVQNRAAGLIVKNNGTVKVCSTGGWITLSDATDVRGDDLRDYSYSTLSTDFSRFILENSGTLNQGFAGAGYRYSKGYANNRALLSNIYYNFAITGHGANYNFYSLQNEKTDTGEAYNSGITISEDKESTSKSTHACPLTVEDYIQENAHEYKNVEDYGSKKSYYRYTFFVVHNHDERAVGSKVASEVAKGSNAANVMSGLNKKEWTFSAGKYPRPKDSLKVSVVEVVGRYVGEVVERTNLDKSKIEFTVYYSDGTIYKFYGNSSDVTYPYGTYIANVGENNIVYFKYTDNRLTGTVWPETGYASFVVGGKERTPIDIVKVEYSGDSITENMSYKPANVRITVRYDNGTQATYLGTSNNVGITTKKNTLGDMDGNGVVNQNDYSILRNSLTLGTTSLSATQKKEADINKDGKISTEDLSELADILSKKVPFDRKTFYVKYAGLEIYKNLTITSVKRKINGLTISSPPNKKKYIEGEDFEPKGMVITAKYDNGEYQSFYFENGDESFDGLSLGSLEYPTESMFKGQDRIPITYTENGSSETVWLNISVRQVYLTSIAITQEPTLTTYASGETFDSRGMKVTAFYDEGVYDDERDDNFSKKSEISLNDCRLTGASKLNDSTAQILVKADQIDDSNRDMSGYVIIQKSAIQSPVADTLTVGTNTTISYKQGTLNKTIQGTVVGNNYVTVSYTENGVTRSAIQPIFVDKKKLTKIETYQQPHKTTYVEGDIFDASGLIIRSYYTDGSTSFVYEMNGTNPNGYEVINGDQPLPIVAELTIKYTENGTSAITTIPITVTRNDIESITASYTGPKVDLGERFEISLVLINVVYKNGTVDSFYADKLIGENAVVDVYKKGTNNKDYQVHDSGDNVEIKDGEYINHYTAWYAGLSADFTVTGIRSIAQIDFSGSVAQGRRDASEWTETFRAVKVKTVYDYINEYAQTGDSGLSDIDGKDGDAINPATKINPLLWFEREGDWVEPVTNFVIEYKARTNGFLFPETGINEDGSIKYEASDRINLDYGSLPYLDRFEQEREALRNPTSDLYKNAGWSDWVRNGDSVGTANAKRIAYDYTDNNPDSTSKTSYIGAAKFRLNTLNGYEFKENEDPKIYIYVNGNENNPYIVTKNSEVEITNIQTLKFKLDGNVYVRDNTGIEQLKSFSEVYRIGYKAGTSNEPYNWKNEWVGIDGLPVECFEVKIQLATAAIDEFSFASTPFIATEPEDVTAVLGTKAIFTVKAVGQNMTYQWYKINAADSGNMEKAIMLGGATKYFYETPEVELADKNSTYFCVVTNGSGSTTTSQAVLYAVDKLPEITGNIEDTAIEVGQSHTFSIAATCMNPSDLSFQWEMTNKNGEWEVVQAASTNNQYTIIATADTQNKYIRCKVTNSRGYVYSNPARISTIIEPTVTITASQTSANLNDTIIFTSYITSYGGLPEYQWYVKDVSNENSTYELQTIEDKVFEFTSSKAGEYKVKCIVKDGNGYSEDPNEINNSENDANAISVKIGNPPNIDSITYNVQKTGTAQEITGTVNRYKATFTAAVTVSDYTKDRLSYQWYKNGKAIQGATSKTLIMTDLSENAQMTILCKVSDVFGNSFLAVELKVEPAANIVIK